MVRRHHILEYDSVYTPVLTSPLHFKCTLVSYFQSSKKPLLQFGRTRYNSKSLLRTLHRRRHKKQLSRCSLRILVIVAPLGFVGFFSPLRVLHSSIDRFGSGSGGGGLVSGCLLLEGVDFGLQSGPTHASSTYTKVKLFGQSCDIPLLKNSNSVRESINQAEGGMVLLLCSSASRPSKGGSPPHP